MGEEESGLFTCGSTLVLGFVISVLLYLYERRTFSVFSDMGIPGPRPWPVLGNMVDLFRLGWGEAELKWTKKYGNVFGYYIGRIPRLHVGDVTILKNILVKNSTHFINRAMLDLDNPPMNKGLFFLNGDAWRRIRNIITPAFSSGKLKLMVNDINECARILTEKLVNSSPNSVSIRDDYFGPFTMDVIARTAFGVEIDAQTDSDEPFVKMAKMALENDKTKHPAFFFAIIFPKFAFLLKYIKIQLWPRDSIDFFCGIAEKIIRQRKVEKIHRNDLMQFIIDAESNQDGNTKEEKSMTEEEIIGQAFIFFVAGYETTASLLQFTAYLLATHSDVQDRLCEEIRTELGDGDINYDDVMTLEYLDQVICESLRMYPPGTRMSRVSDAKVTVDGVTIENKSGISMPIYSIHHDEHYYPEPEKFDPERFSPGNKASILPGQFIPFGHGPRTCVGMRLGLLEAKLALAHVLRKCKFRTCAETSLTLIDGGLLKPKKPIKLCIDLTT